MKTNKNGVKLLVIVAISAMMLASVAIIIDDNDADASTEITDLSTLTTTVSNTDNFDIKLKAGNYNLESVITISKSGTLDLTGCTITCTTSDTSPRIFKIGNGTATPTVSIIGGTLIAAQTADKDGNAPAPIAVLNGSTLSISGTTISSGVYGITIWNGASLVSENVNIESRLSAISGNGTQSGVQVQLKSGSYTSKTTAAVFFPSTATLTITGGTFTGKTGIDIRAGTVSVQNATINVNQTGTVDSTPSADNGPISLGMGIAVIDTSSYGYTGTEPNKVFSDIKVTIKNVTINGATYNYYVGNKNLNGSTTPGVSQFDTTQIATNDWTRSHKIIISAGELQLEFESGSEKYRAIFDQISENSIKVKAGSVLDAKAICGVTTQNTTGTGSAVILAKAGSDGLTISQGSIKIAGTMDVVTLNAIIKQDGTQNVVFDNLIITSDSDTSDTETVTIEGNVHMTGRVVIPEGVKIAKTSNAANITIDNGAVLNIAGKIDTNITVENNGTISITSEVAELPPSIGGNGSVDISAVASEGTISGDWNTTTTYTQNQTITLTGNTTLKAGTQVIIKGKLIIPEAYTLTIEEGAQLVIYSSTALLENNGNIIVQSDAGTITSFGGTVTAGNTGGLIILNGEAVNNGIIDLDWVPAGESTRTNFTMNVSGKFTNNGEIVVGEDSSLYMWNGIINSKGALITINGIAFVDDANINSRSVTISNAGTIIINGTILSNNADEFLPIDITSVDAVVDIVSMKKAGSAVNNSLVITMNGVVTPATSGLTYVGSPSVSIKLTTGYAVEGITFTFEMTKDPVTSTTYYRNIIVDGQVEYDTDSTTAATAAPVIVTVTDDTAPGYVVVKDNFALGVGVELNITGGRFVVDGIVTSTEGKINESSSSYGKITISGGSLTVNGAVTTESEIVTSTYVNAAFYTVAKTTTTPKTYNYTTLANAVSAGATKIEMLGTTYVNSDVTIPSGTTVSMNGSNVTISKDYKITFENGSVLKITSGTMTVNGTLYIADKKTGISAPSANIVSEVISEGEKDRTYTNIVTALSIAEAGQTIKLSGAATIRNDTTIREGIILDTNGKNITVDNDATLTIDGTLFINGGSLVLTAAVAETSSSAAKEAGAVVLNNTIKSITAVNPALKIVGAYFTITDKGIPYYYVQPVALVAPNISTVDNVTIDVNTFGTDLEIGSVSFAGTADKNATINIKGNVIAEVITLDLATIQFDNGVKFVGSITNEVGTSSFDGTTGTGFIVTSTTKDDVKELIVTGAFTVTTKKKITMDGNLTISGFTSTPVTVNGNLKVSGNSASRIDTLTINGSVSVLNGKVLSSTDVYVLGTLDVAVATSTEGAGRFSTTNAYVGITKTAVTGTSAAITGNVQIGNLLYVVDGSSVPESIVEGKKALTLYVENTIWMTIYAMGTNDKVTVTNIPVENVQLLGWTDDKGESVVGSDGTITIKNNKAYAKINYDVYNVSFNICAGIDNVYMDGVLISNSSLYNGIKVNAGDHTISYTLANGYSGTATMLVNGEKITGYKFTASGDYTTTDYKITLQGIEKSGYVPESPDTPTPVEPSEKDDSMGITEYLLIVLVILAAILVVVVAIRMMRS